MVLLSYLSYSLSVVEICLLSILLQRHKKEGVVEIMLICQNKNYVDIHNSVFEQRWQNMQIKMFVSLFIRLCRNDILAVVSSKTKCINKFDTENYLNIDASYFNKMFFDFSFVIEDYFVFLANLESEIEWSLKGSAKSYTNNAFSANIILTAQSLASTVCFRPPFAKYQQN